MLFNIFLDHNKRRYSRKRRSATVKAKTKFFINRGILCKLIKGFACKYAVD